MVMHIERVGPSMTRLTIDHVTTLPYPPAYRIPSPALPHHFVTATISSPVSRDPALKVQVYENEWV
ncbi:hypothetical protein ACHAWF_008906 [Thalassiosira exigua]